MELLGLLMLASWAWSTVILFNRVSNTTVLEKWVLGIGSVSVALFIIGSLSN